MKTSLRSRAALHLHDPLDATEIWSKTCRQYRTRPHTIIQLLRVRVGSRRARRARSAYRPWRRSATWCGALDDRVHANFV